jgi:hypothetical protein
MAWECGFPAFRVVGMLLANNYSKASFPHARRTAMKYETLMLQTIFSACMLVCLLVMGAMLTSKTPVSTAAVSHAPVAVVTSSTD